MIEKIRYKKIRGQNRRLRAIQRWVEINRHLDLKTLKETQRDYVKFKVAPFGQLNITNSVYPEPYGKFKEQFIQGLFDIYQHWKIQLDSLNQPYYLKIWLFQNKISHSQVVCAIGDYLHFYDNTFETVQNSNPQNLNQFINDVYPDYHSLNWQEALEIDAIENTYLTLYADENNPKEYQKLKKWFEHIQNTAIRTHEIKNPTDDVQFYYIIQKDRVWIGG
ncbi:hypothetical protein NGM44_07395 [Moraxella sp. FZFQ2102]|uniref:hypothetical protein n=1 Tax=Moraxella sp. FZFQ2102 TaxID=2953752 RepID=UPI00209C36AF|nr:hypothetical protein [Moraxella sp. FZFQ2102]USZ14213.1 hypothetical protein NGM44_07395 [Moraxella sp. FZFQ2102]